MRQHALELHRTNVLEDLRAIQADDGKVDEDIQRVRRSRVQAKLQRLKPGTSNTIAVLKCADGSLATEPREIARELQRHWGQVFQQKPCDQNMLERWLQEELHGNPAFQADQEQCKLLLKDIQLAISRAPATMPGPDGIPYSAWKRLGILAADVLFAAAQALGGEHASKTCGRRH